MHNRTQHPWVGRWDPQAIVSACGEAVPHSLRAMESFRRKATYYTSGALNWPMWLGDGGEGVRAW